MVKEDQNTNGNDFDYTIVMDASYVGPDVRKAETPEADNRAITDRLYGEYEQMCRRMSAVFDADDLYPHSYQWRMGDRYEPAKVKAVEEALQKGVKIADTEAYEKYAEEVKNRSFMPDSWE